jgi:hypothetical protein
MSCPEKEVVIPDGGKAAEPGSRTERAFDPEDDPGSSLTLRPG